ncbi:MAG: hypothetical protein K8R79_04950, partial [Calditrichales bacterium]|nr:hypothetical protein [Calditrichales bacterium]
MFNYNKILFCKILIIFLALSILIIFNRTASGAGQETKHVKIGVLAKRSPERCLQKWGATAEYLSREIPGYS